MQVEYPKVKVKSNNGCIFMVAAVGLAFFGLMALAAVLMIIPGLSSRNFNFYSFVCGIPILLAAVGVFIFGLVVAARPSQDDAQKAANYQVERQAAERAVRLMTCPKCGRLGDMQISLLSMGSSGSGIAAEVRFQVSDRCEACGWEGNKFMSMTGITITRRPKRGVSDPDPNDWHDYEDVEEPREQPAQYRDWLRRHKEINGKVMYIG